MTEVGSPLTLAAKPLRATKDCMASRLGWLAGCALVVATSVKVQLNPSEGERRCPLIAKELTARAAADKARARLARWAVTQRSDRRGWQA